jgi:hypothetical protein
MSTWIAYSIRKVFRAAATTNTSFAFPTLVLKLRSIFTFQQYIEKYCMHKEQALAAPMALPASLEYMEVTSNLLDIGWRVPRGLYSFASPEESIDVRLISNEERLVSTDDRLVSIDVWRTAFIDIRRLSIDSIEGLPLSPGITSNLVSKDGTHLSHTLFFSSSLPGIIIDYVEFGTYTS